MRGPNDTSHAWGLRTSDHPRSALPRITPSGLADVVTVTAAQQSRIPTGFTATSSGRTMHVTHVSTCDTQITTCRPPAPCRSRPISPLPQTAPSVPCRRHIGHVERSSTWTWGCGRGGTPASPRGISVRKATPCHATWQTPRSPTHLPRRRTDHAPHCRQNSPRRAEHPTLRLSLTLQVLQCE